ncbi:MAG TPA: ATP-binding protein [Hyphomonadaceae bacterium]|nr:ATP-binding protein [Hyphomonadaceae bacterium]HPI48397.1 ATP-binding protein [Hyphomonadaceae bacterium]
MARIRKLEIEGFRGVKSMSWCPNPGVNCLIGPGDSGKSTILDAIDWCIGARRSLQVTDADFHKLNVADGLTIDVTLGDLDNQLKDIESYGLFLRGFDAATCAVEDEPQGKLETALTVRLQIGDDLEPRWSLFSGRAEAQGVSRALSFADRVRIAPTRIGSYALQHLSWQKGSILTRVTDEKVVAPGAFATAAREARSSFGNEIGDQLKATLGVVMTAADELGVAYGDEIQAMLDTQSVSFTDGTISLHDSDGIPLRRLGLGSSRLLVAGLQNRAANAATISLIDEIEHGLEPHRIVRLLYEVGAKDKSQPIQIFLTTHSPAAIRELSGAQLYVVRRAADQHDIICAQNDDAVQGTLRKSAEAFLGTRVLVCEGVTEVGFIRGIDLYCSDNLLPTLAAAGVVTSDAGGVSKIYRQTAAFQKLGYQTATLRDDDAKPDAADEAKFQSDGGHVFKWTDGSAIEDALFASVSDEAVRALYSFADQTHGSAVLDNLKSAAGGALDAAAWLEELNQDKRKILAKAAHSGSWFKRVSLMEDAAREIIGPDLATKRDNILSKVLDEIYGWAGIAGA